MTPENQNNDSDPGQQSWTRHGRMFEEMLRELARAIIVNQGAGDGPSIEHVQPPQSPDLLVAEWDAAPFATAEPSGPDVQPPSIPRQTFADPELPSALPTQSELADLSVAEVMTKLDLQRVEIPTGSIPDLPKTFENRQMSRLPFIGEEIQQDMRAGFTPYDPLGMEEERGERIKELERYDPVMDDTITRMRRDEEETTKYLTNMHKLCEEMATMHEIAAKRTVNIESRLERARCY